MQIKSPRLPKVLEPVPFRDDTIFAVEHDGEPYAPVRPIVENMGLDWSAQSVKLKNYKKRFCVAMIPTQLPGDTQKRTVLCLPVRKLPGFLSTINPNKVKNELRTKIIAYQNECDDVLWRYWSDKHPVVAVAAAPDSRKLEAKLLRTLRSEISRIVPAELDRYARVAAAEEQRQERVKEKLRRLLAEATPRHNNSRTEKRLAELEEKLEAVLELLRK